MAAALPREAGRTGLRCQWISRVPGYNLIGPDAVMEPFGREVPARGAADGHLMLILDWPKPPDRHKA